MEYRQLGPTGHSVSVLALGGVFVSSYGADREQGIATIRRAIELGINYIDTARSYADSESVIGDALRGMSDEVLIATKVGGWPSPFNPRSKSHIRRSIVESLKNLGVDRLAGLQVHEPDRPAQYDWWEDMSSATGPVMEVLEEAKAAGQIGFIGAGGTTAYELARVVKSGRFDTVLSTFNYSLLWREAEHSVLPAAKSTNTGVVIGTPLQQGTLARRYDEEVETSAWLSPPRRSQLRELYRFLDEVGVPIHELALRFVLSNPEVSTVIVGARSVSEIEANVAAAEKGPLDADVIARINTIAAMVPFRPFEEPAGAFGLPFTREYAGPGPLAGT